MEWVLQLAELMAFKELQQCIACLLFSRYLPKRKGYISRTIIGMLVCMVIAFFLPIQSGNALISGTLVFIAHIILSMIWLFTVYKVDLSILLFIGAAGKITTYIAGNLDTLYNYLRPRMVGIPEMFSVQGGLFFLRASVGMIIVYPIVFFLLGNKWKQIEINNRWKPVIRMIFLLVILIDVFVYLLNGQYIEQTATLLPKMIFLFISMLINILLLLLLNFCYVNSRMKTELDSVNALWSRSRAHYEMSKENIEAINRKCHDLKHRMLALQKSDVKMNFEDIEKAVQIYDSSINTGNEALDVVLTEKTLLCADKNIRMECMADGNQLDFMDQTDIFVLFGNLLDNCIEAVEPLEGEKRFILINVQRNSGFVLIHTTNPYDAQLQWKDGLPLTTKKDKDEHGYGMLSIEMIVKRYGGEISIQSEKDLFDINIIFPLKVS